MQETSDVEIGGVLKKLIDSSPKPLHSDLEEGLLVPLWGVMEVAGSQALGPLTFVLQALDAMPGDEWEDEDEDSYYLMKTERRTLAPTWRARALESVEGFNSVSCGGGELCRTTCWGNIGNG